MPDPPRARVQVPASNGSAVALRLIEKAEFGELVDDEYTFTHTGLLYTNGTDLFRARLPRRIEQEERIDLTALRGHRISPEDIYPPFEERFSTLAPHHLLSNIHVKRQSMNYYMDEAEEPGGHSHIRETVHGEVEVCEVLKRSPHRHIAEYMGCVVEDGRIVALCFRRYEETLEQRIRDANGHVDVNNVIRCVRSGLEHLHALGYCHNDIHPGNIMFDKSDMPVIIDFDSCQRVGKHLGPKAGKPGFFPERTDTSKPENDFYGLAKVETFLYEALKR